MDPLLIDLGLALGLGLLVGFERERASQDLAGIRTFGLITLLGAVAAALAESLGAWVHAAIVIAVAATIWASRRASREEGGVTTEIAALLMFSVGSLVALGHHTVAVVTTGAVAVLLHWKQPLHAWVRKVGDEDLRELMRFVLVGLVILPALPDTSYGPFHVLNPFRIWLMVVLIVGISLGAYVGHRLAGPRVGTLLAGVLGGLISSTATAVSYARRTSENSGEVAAAAVVLILSSATVFLRIVVEIAIVTPRLLAVVAPPLLAMMLTMGAIAACAWGVARGGFPVVPGGHLPSNLRAAIAFGLLYAAVLFCVAAAKEHLGEAGLYSVAVLSGLTDVDAITLSSAELAKGGRLTPDLAWRLILVGAMSNLMFKGVVVAALGVRRLLLWVFVMFGASVAAGGAILAFWPG